MIALSAQAQEKAHGKTTSAGIIEFCQSVFRSKGEKEKARIAEEKILRKLKNDPANPALLYNAGVYLYIQEKYPAAESYFENAKRAAKLNTDAELQHKIQYNLGTTQLKINDPTEAVESLTAASKLKPNDPDTLANLKTALIKREEHYKQIKTLPDVSGVLCNLKDLKGLNGDSAEATSLRLDEKGQVVQSAGGQAHGEKQQLLLVNSDKSKELEKIIATEKKLEAEFEQHQAATQPEVARIEKELESDTKKKEEILKNLGTGGHESWGDKIAKSKIAQRKPKNEASIKDSKDWKSEVANKNLLDELNGKLKTSKVKSDVKAEPEYSKILKASVSANFLLDPGVHAYVAEDARGIFNPKTSEWESSEGWSPYQTKLSTEDETSIVGQTFTLRSGVSAIKLAIPEGHGIDTTSLRFEGSQVNGVQFVEGSDGQVRMLIKASRPASIHFRYATRALAESKTQAPQKLPDDNEERSKVPQRVLQELDVLLAGAKSEKEKALIIQAYVLHRAVYTSDDNAVSAYLNRPPQDVKNRMERLSHLYFQDSEAPAHLRGKGVDCDVWNEFYSQIARAYGLQSRRINGYLNYADGDLSAATESERHTWSEVWLKDEKHWQMIDSTPGRDSMGKSLSADQKKSLALLGLAQERPADHLKLQKIRAEENKLRDSLGELRRKKSELTLGPAKNHAQNLVTLMKLEEELTLAQNQFRNNLKSQRDVLVKVWAQKGENQEAQRLQREFDVWKKKVLSDLENSLPQDVLVARESALIYAKHKAAILEILVNDDPLGDDKNGYSKTYREIGQQFQAAQALPGLMKDESLVRYVVRSDESNLVLAGPNVFKTNSDSFSKELILGSKPGEAAEMNLSVAEITPDGKHWYVYRRGQSSQSSKGLIKGDGIEWASIHPKNGNVFSGHRFGQRASLDNDIQERVEYYLQNKRIEIPGRLIRTIPLADGTFSMLTHESIAVEGRHAKTVIKMYSLSEKGELKLVNTFQNPPLRTFDGGNNGVSQIVVMGDHQIFLNGKLQEIPGVSKIRSLYPMVDPENLDDATSAARARELPRNSAKLSHVAVFSPIESECGIFEITSGGLVLKRKIKPSVEDLVSPTHHYPDSIDIHEGKLLAEEPRQLRFEDGKLLKDLSASGMVFDLDGPFLFYRYSRGGTRLKAEQVKYSRKLYKAQKDGTLVPIADLPPPSDRESGEENRYSSLRSVQPNQSDSTALFAIRHRNKIELWYNGISVGESLMTKGQSSISGAASSKHSLYRIFTDDPRKTDWILDGHSFSTLNAGEGPLDAQFNSYDAEIDVGGSQWRFEKAPTVDDYREKMAALSLRWIERDRFAFQQKSRELLAGTSKDKATTLRYVVQNYLYHMEKDEDHSGMDGIKNLLRQTYMKIAQSDLPAALKVRTIRHLFSTDYQDQLLSESEINELAKVSIEQKFDDALLYEIGNNKAGLIRIDLDPPSVKQAKEKLRKTILSKSINGM